MPRLRQMDAAQAMNRAEAVCPQPRRSTRLPFFVETVNKANPKSNGAFPVCRSDSTPDLIDLILSTHEPDGDIDSSSHLGYFSGSPPIRANNPVIHDPQFGRIIPSCSPLGSSWSKKPSGRAEVGSPSCGASSPKVRIEGFACRNSEHCRAVTFT